MKTALKYLLFFKSKGVGVLPAPTGLTVYPNGTNKDRIRAEWNPVDGASVYTVDYSTDGVTWSHVADIVSNGYNIISGIDYEALRHYVRVQADGGDYAYADMSGLLLGMISFWGMDEDSGDAPDAIGTNVLTDHNAVDSTFGLIGNARYFNAPSSQYLEINTNESINLSDTDWTIATWVNPSNLLASRAYLGKWGGTSTDLYTVVGMTGQVYLQVHVGGVDASHTSANDLVTAGQWNLIVLQHDSSSNEIRISVNGGTPSSHNVGGSLDEWGEEPLSVGRWAGGQYWLGAIDQTAIIRRVWNEDQIIVYYNAGAGLSYPF